MTDAEIREIEVNENTLIEIDGAGDMHVDTATDDYDAPSEYFYFDLTEWDAKVVLTRKPKVYPAGTVVRGSAVGHYIKQVDGKWRYLPDDRPYASGDPDGEVTLLGDTTVAKTLGTVVYEPGSDA